MSDRTQNSSLPLLLGITAAVVACVGGGWFLLGQSDTAQIETSGAPNAVQQMSLRPVSPVAAAISELEMNLRKARLAVESDLLAFPGEQSALHYYSRVLAAEPDHALARAEFDDVLDRLERQAARYLDDRDYTDAYSLANVVAEQEPEHPLVSETRQKLDAYADELANKAQQYVKSGDDAQADAVIAAAGALPGRNRQYMSSLRASVADLRKARNDKAEKKRQLAIKAADTQNAWLARFRGAIQAERLIQPARDNARDYLAAGDAPGGLENQVTGELVTALLATCQAKISTNRLGEAESLLLAAVQLGADMDSLARLRSGIDDAHIRNEEIRVRTMHELVRTKTVAPRYPARAAERGTSGWVDLSFTVTPAGDMSNVEVLQSEPQNVFDLAAIEAAEQWRFEPLEVRGRIISQRGTARLAFRLE